jgi:pimeloyl-ACP methyl ester carboxylesterase
MQFFLIHGGWQGGWSWDGVVAELERRGHTAVAPTLPGLEPDSADRSGGSLSRFIWFATNELIARDMSDVVIVGHSGGGSVAQGVAERAHDRIRLLAFMSARVLLNGESILSMGGEDRRQAYMRAAEAAGDGAVPLAEDTWINSLCRDVGEAQAREWMTRVVPCPIGWLTEPADNPTSAWRRIPSAYIFLDGERPEATARYAEMAARLISPRTTHCVGAHQAMLSQPVAVAEAILRVSTSTEP